MSNDEEGASQPHPVGRPTKYQTEFVERARELCQGGATIKELADVFEVGTTTIWRWTCEHPAFRCAVKLVKETADDRVERSLFERANGYFYAAEKIHVTKDGEVIRVPYTEHVPPDPTAMIFWLKNRRPETYREKKDEVAPQETVIRIIGGPMALQEELAKEEADRLATLKPKKAE